MNSFDWCMTVLESHDAHQGNITVLEAYDYDLRGFVREDYWLGDLFDEMALKWRPILADGVEDGQAWRLLLLKNQEVERVDYLSRPPGF